MNHSGFDYSPGWACSIPNGLKVRWKEGRRPRWPVGAPCCWWLPAESAFAVAIVATAPHGLAGSVRRRLLQQASRPGESAGHAAGDQGQGPTSSKPSFWLSEVEATTLKGRPSFALPAYHRQPMYNDLFGSWTWPSRDGGRCKCWRGSRLRGFVDAWNGDYLPVALAGVISSSVDVRSKSMPYGQVSGFLYEGYQFTRRRRGAAATALDAMNLSGKPPGRCRELEREILVRSGRCRQPGLRPGWRTTLKARDSARRRHGRGAPNGVAKAEHIHSAGPGACWACRCESSGCALMGP